MRSICLTVLVLAAGSAPALADPQPPQSSDWSAQNNAYSAERALESRCVGDIAVSGANRVGAQTILVQARHGAIYNLSLAGSCDALDTAENIAVQANNRAAACTDGGATMVVRGASGVNRCAIRDVRRITRAEAKAFSTAAAQP